MAAPKMPRPMTPARRSTPAPAKPRRAWFFSALLIAAAAFAILGGLRKTQSFFFGSSADSSTRYVLLEFSAGMVLDRRTKLVWHRCPLGTTQDKDGVGPVCKGDAAWIDAQIAQSEERHFSQFGQPWRLPTVDELKGLSIAPDRCCYSLDPIAFPVMEEPPERVVGQGHAFHTAGIDKARRLSWRVDAGSGRAVEEPLRQEAFVRLVRQATPEELSNSSTTKPIDRSQLASTEASLKPRPRPRSDWFVEGRNDAIRNGWVSGRDCTDIADDQRQRGCRDGVQANVNARMRQGVEWAKANQPARLDDCRLDDRLAIQGCQQYFHRYLSDER